MTAAEIAKALNAKKSGDGWIANCVAHDDKRPSMSISEKDGKVLVKCHAKCDQDAVIAKLRDRGLWNGADRSDAPDDHPTLGAPSTSYDYHNSAGRHVGRVMRFDRQDGKEIRQCSLHGDEWTWKAMPAPRPLYRLPELLMSTQPALVVEGEKAVAAATKIMTGMCVTTWAGGAKTTEKTDFAMLKNRDVILWPDNDQPGRDAMNAIARRLQGSAASVRMFDPAVLGELPDGWDAADALADKDCDLQAVYDALINAPVVEDRVNSDAPDSNISKCDSAPDPLAHIRASILGDINAGPGAIDAATAPEFVCYPVLPIAGANLAGSGGSSKTTAVLNEKVRIVNGGEVYGCPVDLQGPCVLVTAEDGAAYARYLLQQILIDGANCGALPNQAAQRAKHDIRIIGWPRAKYGPIVRIDELGGFHRADVFDLLLELILPLQSRYVTLDPSVLFSPGERYGNDGDAFTAAMLHEAALELRACVQIIDHVAQSVARNGIVDQYAARGGTAKTDNARLARQLVRVTPEAAENLTLPTSVTADDIANGSILQLHWTKSNYAPRPLPVWLRRRRYWIEHLHSPSADETAKALALDQSLQTAADAAVIVECVRQQLAVGDGIRQTQRDLEATRPVLLDGQSMPRQRVRDAVRYAVATGLLSRRELPSKERVGQRKEYLAP